MVNVAIEFAILNLVYLVSRRLGANSVASLAALFLCGGASLHMGLATQFLVESLQSLCVVALILMAWRSERVPLLALLSRVLLCVAAALLTKSSSFVFIVPMLTYVAVARFIAPCEFKEKITIFDYFTGALALIFVVMAIAWYGINWKSMARHFVETTTTSDISLLYGHVGSFGEKLAFWIRALGLALSPSPWLLVFLVLSSIFALGVSCLKVGRHSIRDWPVESLKTGILFAGALAGTVVLIVVGLATQVMEDTRFLAPVIPILAILLSWSLATLHSTILTWMLIGATIGNAAVGAAYVHRLTPVKLAFTCRLTAHDHNEPSRCENRSELTS
jgi:hypothetical protein